MRNERTDWNPLTVVVKALAMTVPWGVVEVGTGKSGLDFGYYLGMIAGIIVFCLVPPREKHPWKWCLGGAILAVIHYFMPRDWR